jgi:hypothetical protein
MNIGRDAAMIASQTGIRRVVEVMDPILSLLSNDYKRRH